MKILLLNPHIDAQHQLVKALQKTGVGILLAQNVDQAAQVLQFHGSTVDIAIVHREGGAGLAHDYGLSLLFKLKADPAQADLPVLVTSEIWKDTEFLNHQATPLGANGYIHWPCDEAEVISLISKITGSKLSAGDAANAAPPLRAVQLPPISETPLAAELPGFSPPGSPLSEEASGIFISQESVGGIQLEAPEESGGSPVLEILEPPSAQETVAPTGTKATAVPPPFRGNTQFIQAGQAASPNLEIPSQVSIAALTEPTSGSDPKLELPEPALPPLGEPLTGESEPRFDLGAPSFQANPGEPNETEPSIQGTPDLSSQEQDQLAQELPYLFGGREKPAAAIAAAQQAIAFARPVGDAVVPGGAAQAPDVETLKKYLMLREQDVSALSNQLRSSQQRIAALEDLLAGEQARAAELSSTAHDQKRRIESFEAEKTMAVESIQSEMNEFKFQVRAKTDKARLLEIQVRAATEEMEKLKERVRADIRKIRIREKELENRLEIMRKDSEVLISSRETRIIELKRKLDLMEFNMDLLQNQLSREKDNTLELKKRLTKAAQVVRVAGGLLGSSAGEALEEISGGLDAADGEPKTRAS
jgi:hypothetical protein